MKITLAILTLLFTFIANAQVPERDLGCEEEVLQTGKALALELSQESDKLYRQTTVLSHFKGGHIEVYNTETRSSRYEVKLVFRATRGRRVTEYAASMTVDETCKKVVEGSYSQTPIAPLPQK